MAPLVLTLTDLGDGLWRVAHDGSVHLTLNVPGQLALGLSAEEVRWTGTFDESLAAFVESEGVFRNFVWSQRATPLYSPPTEIAYRIDSATYSTRAGAGAGGGVDGTMRYDMTGLSEVVTMPGFEFTLSAASYGAGGNVTGMRSMAFYDLIAWFVANPAPDLITGRQDEMKERVRALLPIFGAVDAAGAMRDIAISTPFGEFGIDWLGIDVEMTGLVAEGRFRERLAFAGLKLPAGLVPEWAAALIPTDVTIDFTLSDFDLAGPVEELLGFDLMWGPPLDLEQRLLAALLPSGQVAIRLGPTAAEGAGWSFGIEGQMSAGPMSMPVGAFDVELGGFETILGALNAGPRDVSQGAAPAFLMARGLAKAEGDVLQWRIEMTEDQRLLVNGNDLSALAR